MTHGMISNTWTIRRTPCLFMFLAALALRLAWILIFRSYIFPLVVLSPPFSIGDPNFQFGHEIGSIAHSIATGHGFGSPFGPITGPTAWIAPVYPYLCAAVFRVFGVFTPASAFVILSLNSIFSALTCVPLYRICERTMGHGVGLFTGWTWALLPYFMLWPATVIWETSLVPLLLAYLVLMTLELEDAANTYRWSRWLMFGLLWGVALLTNPGMLTFLPVSFGWLLFRRWAEKERLLRPAAMVLVMCALVVMPWLARNRIVFGQFVFIRSNFGFEFHLGNYHFSNGLGWAGKHPCENKSERDQYSRMGEIAYVAAKRDEAVEFVRQYPREFFQLTAKRVYFFWSDELLLYGRNPPLAWMYGLLSLMAPLGLLFAVRDKIKGAGLMLGVILVYPLPYYVAFPQLRNRHAIEPELLALSVYFLVSVLRQLRIVRETPRVPSLPANFGEADSVSRLS